MLIFLGKHYLGQSDRHEVTAPPLTFEVEHIVAKSCDHPRVTTPKVTYLRKLETLRYHRKPD